MALFFPLFVMAGIYNGLVATIGGITSSTFGLIKRVYTHKNPDITKILGRLDLERRLILIQAILNTMDSDNLTINVEKEIKDPVEVCLVFLRQSIQDIHDDLSKIDAKVLSHKKKWFNSWRTLNVKELLETLEIHSIHLDNRFEDLNKVSTFITTRKMIIDA